MSMDGPNVNWKTYELLSTSIEKETNKKMLNIGSCGLHNSQCLPFWKYGNQLGIRTNLELTLLII